jgi:molybdopterin molybdotransferase
MEVSMSSEPTHTYPMLSVEEAQERMLALVQPLGPEQLPILEGLGRVLAEDVCADTDIPPLDNSAMDGYAIRAEDIIGATRDHPVRLPIIGNLAAGYTFEGAVKPGTAVRIMTGAPVPPGADTVIRFERTRRDGDEVEILQEVKLGRNIRRAGEDVRRGELVLSQGTLLRPQEIGMLASLGRAEASVTRRPRVAILATGEEVIPIDHPLAPGKIHNANSYSNAAQVLRYGGVPLLLGIARDRREELSAKIQGGLEQGVDLFLTSGGVSVGDFDMVKEVLAAEGEIHFWWVNMKPGKPLAFGQIGGVPMLGLPGNPVAAMISTELFARPAILKMLGRKEWAKPSIEAVLQDAITRKDDRRHYLRVQVWKEGEQHYAGLTGPQGSGILKSMVQASGLAVIPEERTELAAGERVQVLMLDWPEGAIL